MKTREMIILSHCDHRKRQYVMTFPGHRPIRLDADCARALALRMLGDLQIMDYVMGALKRKAARK